MSDSSSLAARRRGETDETDETRTDRPERSDGTERRRCPECESAGLVADEEHGETVCDDCGLVVEEDSVDRGPEWRAFDAAERDEKARVGAPTTNTMHDKGLSTNIGRENRDSKGNALSSKQRKRIHRLRTWNERFRTRDAKERNLKQALGEINRMASALGLPGSVRETASVIYRRALDDGLLPGRSIEGVATASLYAAARMAHVPRSLDELARVSRVDEREFQGAYRYLVRELGLQIEPADPAEYLPRFASELDVPAETERTARELLEDAKEANVHSGKSPVGLAAAALYAAVRLTNVHVTQTMIADVSDVSEVTIRNRYRELLDAGGETPFSDGPTARENS